MIFMISVVKKYALLVFAFGAFVLFSGPVSMQAAAASEPSGARVTMIVVDDGREGVIKSNVTPFPVTDDMVNGIIALTISKFGKDNYIRHALEHFTDGRVKTINVYLKPPTKENSKAMRACFACNAKATDERLLKCSGCRVAWYCNKDCQKAHWKEHKAECRAIIAASSK